MKSIQALQTSLWHRFRERIDVLERFGYLNAQAQLTADGEWAADPHRSLTAHYRADPCRGLGAIEPALLAAVMARYCMTTIARLFTRQRGTGHLLFQVRSWRKASPA